MLQSISLRGTSAQRHYRLLHNATVLVLRGIEHRGDLPQVQVCQSAPFEQVQARLNDRLPASRSFDRRRLFMEAQRRVACITASVGGSIRAVQAVFQQGEDGIEGGAGIGLTTDELGDLEDIARDGAGGDVVGLTAELGGDGGRTDIPIELVTTGRWNLAALIADHFSDGRIFLAGDAAHQLPPNRGGFGANTGIDDAHNLAWKLAAVLSGRSDPRLLDTYDTERRPIADLRHDQLFARADYKAYLTGPASDTPVLDDSAIELGQLYRSAAVLGADASLPPAALPEQWAGRPGTRAPHRWITLDGRSARRSISSGTTGYYCPAITAGAPPPPR